MSLILITVILFCVFGYIATYEPLEKSIQLTWRIVYGIIGVAAIVGMLCTFNKG